MTELRFTPGYSRVAALRLLGEFGGRGDGGITSLASFDTYIHIAVHQRQPEEENKG